MLVKRVMGSSVQQFTVPHKNLSLDIKGNKTDIVICSYDDHILVIATQIGTMGTILHARKEEGVSIHPTFSVSVIFGKRDDAMLVACARQLIEHISSSGSSRPLVLSLGLKDHSMETLKGIVSAVVENRTCSINEGTFRSIIARKRKWVLPSWNALAPNEHWYTPLRSESNLDKFFFRRRQRARDRGNK